MTIFGMCWIFSLVGFVVGWPLGYVFKHRKLERQVWYLERQLEKAKEK